MNTGTVLTSQAVKKLVTLYNTVITQGKVEPSTGHTIQLVGTGLVGVHTYVYYTYNKVKQNF